MVYISLGTIGPGPRALLPKLPFPRMKVVGEVVEG
jgi:hypothetical protein